MATHIKHEEKDTFYFVTFTCYNWLSLIDKTFLYDYIIGWTSQLSKRRIKVCGYVIMPNHLHLLVYIENSCRGLNSVIGEAKRFMSYEIIKRLKHQKEFELLKILSKAVQPRERKIGKKHQVFRLSFDAKEVSGEREINKVLDYIHYNPVNGKWQLASDFVEYPYSSAKYYELGEQREIEVYDYRTVTSESPADDSE